jgi:hypothetical protein
MSLMPERNPRGDISLLQTAYQFLSNIIITLRRYIHNATQFQINLLGILQISMIMILIVSNTHVPWSYVLLIPLPFTTINTVRTSKNERSNNFQQWFLITTRALIMTYNNYTICSYAVNFLSFIQKNTLIVHISSKPRGCTHQLHKNQFPHTHVRLQPRHLTQKKTQD